MVAHIKGMTHDGAADESVQLWDSVSVAVYPVKVHLVLCRRGVGGHVVVCIVVV